VQGGLEAELEGLVERHQDGRTPGCRLGWQPEMGLPGIVAEGQFAAVGIGVLSEHHPQKAWIKRRPAVKADGCRLQHHDAGKDLRQPQSGSRLDGNARIVDKISTPSGERGAGYAEYRQCLTRFCEMPWHNRDGIWSCGAGIRRQSRDVPGD
jgi:hypothetical protein